MEKLRSLFAAGKANFDHNCRRVAVGSALLASAGSVFAQTGDSIDTTEVLAKIAAGVAAGLVVSVAMTAAVLGLKASKLPRRAG